MSKHVKESEQEGEEGFDAETIYSNLNDVSLICSLFLLFSRLNCIQEIDHSTRTAISRVTNIIKAFASRFVPLTDKLLLEAYEWTVEQETSVKDLLQEEFGDALVASVTNI